MVGFSQELRADNSENWTAAVKHRFVDEIFRGAVTDDVMRRYLVQDYQFVDRFVALIGTAIATADRFDSRVRFAQFAAMITSDENTYFLRAFDRLGVADADRHAPELSPATRAFQKLMAEAAQQRSYAGCLAVLCVAEWLYLDWADRPGAELPENFVQAEWITLHNNGDFRAFVTWLRAEFDRTGTQEDEQSRARAADLFRRAVACERDFFDHVYDNGV